MCYNHFMIKSKFSKPLAILVLCFIIIFTAIFSIREYFRNVHFLTISQYRNEVSIIISQNHGPLTEKNTSIINSWMTFDYINVIFKLPKDYLKTSLHIVDIHYPKISISKYVKANKLDINTFLSEVKNSVNSYFLNQNKKYI